jgi:hypothetical protein
LNNEIKQSLYEAKIVIASTLFPILNTFHYLMSFINELVLLKMSFINE